VKIKDARIFVYARSCGWCEVRIPGVCFGRAGNWHHRRSAGRIWTPSNGLHLCGSGSTGCHGWITEHPAEARERGWALLSGQSSRLEPAVITAKGQWCYLTENGRYVPAPNRTVPPAPNTRRD
jgi:hypothetical protein